MKNNKGITLVSMIGYVILAIMALAVLVALTTNFKKNFDELDVQAVQDIELDKINMQISKDIKDGKKLDKSNFSSTKLAFIDGNKYTYVSKDKTLYMNDNVAVAEHLRSCVFELPSEDILRVTAQVEDEIRTMEFSLEGVYVARIEKEYYRTLQSAIDAVPANNVETTITILTDISENTTIAQNQNIVLDIGIYTINNKEDNAVITTSGNLKIQNGKITGNPTEQPLINNKNTGALNIVGGTITSDTSIALGNYGTIEISGTAKISGKPTIANKAGGHVIATGGNISSSLDSTIENYGIVDASKNANIECETEEVILENGQSIVNHVIKNYSGGATTITGGNIISLNSYAIYNSGILRIGENASIKAKKFALDNTTKGEVTITGGKLTSTDFCVIGNSGRIEISGTSQIESDVSNSIAVTSTGTITITGGRISSANSPAIRNAGTLNIFELANIEGKSTRWATIHNDSGGVLMMTGGRISSTAHNALNNAEGATATITGGAINSPTTSYAIYNLGTATVSGTTINGSTYGI